MAKIAECNYCGEGIEPQEICIRTEGEIYHTVCQDALNPEVTRIEMTGAEAFEIDDDLLAQLLALNHR